MSDADGKLSADREADQIRVYLDGDDTPVAAYRPPARIQLDTSELDDGPHKLRIEAEGRGETLGERTLEFEVRNGPSIEVDGLEDGDVVEGELSMMIHAWGGASIEDWEPLRSESPAPAPTWAWVLLIVIFAWALYYGIQYWRPTDEFADAPTYSPTQSVESADE